MANSWFILNPNGDPCLPSSYTKVAGTPSCMGTNQICAIFAHVDVGNVPVIDGVLCCEMLQALNSRSNTINVKLKA